MTTASIQHTFAAALQLHQAGRLAHAETLYRQILGIKPDHAETLHHLGIIAHQAGRFDLAIDLIRQAAVLDPKSSSTHSDLGEACRTTGRLDEATTALRRALDLQPDLPEAHNHLGNVLRSQGQFEEAVAEFRRAIELRPDYPAAYSDMGIALDAHGQVDEAIAAFRRALQLQSDHPVACNNLGNALKDNGQLDEAIAAYRHALESQSDHPCILSNLIYVLHLHPNQDERMIAEYQRRWNQQFSEPLRQYALPHANSRDPTRRLRIGYVSSDLWSHAVSFFLVPLLEVHDHAAVEVYCYSSGQKADAITERLRQATDVWRDVRGLPNNELAERIRADGVDILIDLAMHTAGNRLPVFAQRPAPVQVSWLAYPGSTGMDAIDYRITDAHLDPAGQTHPGPEKAAVPLRDAWCCYAPIKEFPPVTSLPAAQNGFVTFGSLHQWCKVNEDLQHSWARLLALAPTSRLLLVCPPGQARERARALFALHGIAPERVEFAKPCQWSEYVHLLERIDLALDAYPCNGMTTTCHALWMGVPVITRTGPTAVSRAGLSLLHTVGLSKLVAHSEAEYIRLAATWAHDLPRLAETRSALRWRMENSPLMDAPRFARNIESAYRTMWQSWCAEASSPR